MRVAPIALLLLLAAPPLAHAQSPKGYTPVATFAGGPEEGHRAPTFSLPWATKDTTSAADFDYNLREDRGKVIVLAFYPRDFTASSTAELRSFARQYDQLFGSGVVVLGISPDPVATHRQFAASLDLPFRLLSDQDQRIAGKYGSRSSDTQPVRTVYVLGRDGTVSYRDLRFDPSSQSAMDHLRDAVKAAVAR